MRGVSSIQITTVEREIFISLFIIYVLNRSVFLKIKIKEALRRYHQKKVKINQMFKLQSFECISVSARELIIIIDMD